MKYSIEIRREIADDEYVDVEFPFWYKGTFVSLMVIAVIIFAVATLLSLIFRLPLLSSEEVETLFVLGGFAAFLVSMICGIMLIVGLMIFPTVIKKRT